VPNHKRNATATAVALSISLAAGCSAIVADNLPQALGVTAYRARYDLECQDVQTSVLSQKVVKGQMADSSEHTIQASGCGRELVYLTTCSDTRDCTAVEKKDQPLEFKQRMEP
jgi:hypothetical protein